MREKEIQNSTINSESTKNADTYFQEKSVIL